MNIVYVLAKFPNLTETFILNEISELKRCGVNLKVLAVNEGKSLSAYGDQKAGIDINYFYKHLSFRNFKAHAYLISNAKRLYFKGLFRAVLSHKFSLRRLLSNLKAFSIAGYFLFMLKGSHLKLFHAHFINFPASIALYMSELSGIPFSCTAHANDIYRANIHDIKHKIRKSKFIVTCTSANKQYLSELCEPNNKTKIHHIYHGIDKEKWCFQNKHSRVKIFHILSVARLVEKKGLIYLLEAIEVLVKKNFQVQCSIIGDGPLLLKLNQFVKKKNIEKFVTFYGALAHSEVKDIYKTSDCFVLPCRVDHNGDKDGLPNVLLEAMALGIPVVTTPVSAIPELVENNVTGIIVSENDSSSITDAIIELINNPKLSQSLSEKGRRVIEKRFNIQTSTNQLINLFSKL